MFDFRKFYKGLFNDNRPGDYIDQYPSGYKQEYKNIILELLKDSILSKNHKKLENALTVAYWDGTDKDYSNLLIPLLKESWHYSHEDIISILEYIADPASVNALYEKAIDIPDYDEMRAEAKKCIDALGAIRNKEAIEKLKLLEKMNDWIISEAASNQLKHITSLS